MKTAEQLRQEDTEAYQGARCFYNFFLSISVLTLTVESLLLASLHPAVLATILICSFLSKYFYEQCHWLNTGVPPTP